MSASIYIKPKSNSKIADLFFVDERSSPSKCLEIGDKIRKKKFLALPSKTVKISIFIRDSCRLLHASEKTTHPVAALRRTVEALFSNRQWLPVIAQRERVFNQRFIENLLLVLSCTGRFFEKSKGHGIKNLLLHDFLVSTFLKIQW